MSQYIVYRNVITNFKILAQPLWCNKLLQIPLVLRVTQQGYKGGRGPLGILKLYHYPNGLTEQVPPYPAFAQNSGPLCLPSQPAI